MTPPPAMPPDAHLKSLKTVRKFKEGKKSAGVYLLEEKLILKRYRTRTSVGYARFWCEVYMLHHLLGYARCPQLLAYDPKSGKIWETYVGDRRPNKRSERHTKAQLKILKQLETKWHVDSRPYRCPHVGFLVNREGKMRIIDFGASRWRIQGKHVWSTVQRDKPEAVRIAKRVPREF
jgi:hypothetical protein